MHVPRACLLLSLTGLVCVSARPLCSCELKVVAQLPVTMSGMRPMVHASINGSDRLFIADSGAFYSLLTPAAAEELKLRLLPAPSWFAVFGVGGEAHTWVTRVRTFTIFNVPVPNVDFVVAGNDFGGGAVGLLGQNLFRAFGDIEYDLANGIIRIIRPNDCARAPLAYWATSQPYSVIDIEHATNTAPHTAGEAFLNGVKIRVIFDTGAATSVLMLEAAKRAGVTPDSPGVVAAGEGWGIGSRLVKTWIAPFASFKIGDEEIRNTRLRIGAGSLFLGATGSADMLLGADFFLSHRVYVANSQRRLYFTYNGGPVFNLSTTPASANAGAPAATTPQDSAPAPGAAGQPTDADGFARRGAAYAARRDYPHAIADLTRACELAPTEAGYFYQRGTAYFGNAQPALAMSDFDRALTIKPDDPSALLARAELHAQRQENAAALADLDAASRSAANETDARLRIGSLYVSLGQFAPAIVQFTDWIDAHPRDDVHTPDALNLRCWARALSGQELEQALHDCDAALKLRPATAAYLDSRGLVLLRRGDYDKAIADYDRALSLRPKDAWSYYGRGIARLRKGMTTEGHDDIAAATALSSTIAEQAAKRGIAP
jgi:tetratricopeptide (TPR) repeat protein/predicted aspartyl protease